MTVAGRRRLPAGHARAGVEQLLGQVADLGQAAVLPDRPRPERQSLIPLYWAGLWLAVNIAPGTPSAPLA